MERFIAPKWIVNDLSRITIIVIGAGGTGSHLLANLARMDLALTKLDRKGIYVTAYDNDIIHSHNCARQMFNEQEIGDNKATAMISKINRTYGLDWFANPIRFEPKASTANIVITCVDSVESRRNVFDWFYYTSNSNNSEFRRLLWIDIGNTNTGGQIILSDYERTLKNIFDIYPNMEENKDEPSCSMEESLDKQGIVLNQIMASFATNMIYELLRFYYLNYSAIFLNLNPQNSSINYATLRKE